MKNFWLLVIWVFLICTIINTFFWGSHSRNYTYDEYCLLGYDTTVWLKCPNVLEECSASSALKRRQFVPLKQWTVPHPRRQYYSTWLIFTNQKFSFWVHIEWCLLFPFAWNICFLAAYLVSIIPVCAVLWLFTGRSVMVLLFWLHQGRLVCI
jgi:hypothetical protein